MRVIVIIHVLVTAGHAKGIIIRAATFGGVHFDADIVLEGLIKVASENGVRRDNIDPVAAVRIIRRR